MKYIVKINQTEYEVEVEKGTASIVNTTVGATAAPAPTAAPVPAAVSQPSAVPASVSAPTTNAGDYIVKSPMPGTILDIRVQPGSSVKRGAVLLILEAMKMENEIVAPIDGTIGQIYVIKGASVATNEIMVSII